MKILVIGPSWVGDMVMSQSLYKRLKYHHPDALIDVLAPAWCKPILERMPEVRRAIEMPVGHGQFSLSERWDLGKSLREEQYDHAYVLPNSAKSALIPLFAKVPYRTGWKGEMRYGLLNDLRPDRRVFQFMVERYVALAHNKDTMLSETMIDDIPHPSLNVDETNQLSCLKRFNISKNLPIVGLCPGAEFGPAKRWPEQHYAYVAKQLITEGNQVCLFGGPKDKSVTEGIVNALSEQQRAMCFNLAGETSLVDAVDLLAACHTVFSNDSGLMHVAAAVNANIVAIYGSSSPKYTPPLSTKVRIVNTDINCRPCFKRECPLGHLDCLNKLSPQQVLSSYYDLTSTLSVEKQ
ncbi:lipopolysaccharide heptosyltransferase II [Enterovibrio norvegicus]|uniref:lipopolysaccharide heptosyltransferase II n=1 Tax=Enterovibrio norvegicus TaxID=188144 RepID=UPI000C8374DC|nr:lipopolysaccharide heptosyltransferase II [Enterovibrio norvegicus]MCC4800123.1 lipopolysaccharide heptosyltransferase II [Enterovibrio norvegicus]PMH71794.1 lipopolysaccharide heptosyltransferase II [Enterovibrio norvegicus]PMI35512.1 lipopolysaccharide heptosyltransferase II [Enterovibrio norvegicus]PMI38190.1 lipopolysaccharide heptosyltransferase II [Enterovibrio norvegicus]PMN55461.1 lipopolysaccharide heptosyltransferase II [Enterovibrio norvegicus]